MLLIRYKANRSWGGCHCHGPDERRDSEFDVDEVASFEEAVGRSVRSVVDDERYSPKSHAWDDDFAFWFVRPATPAEVAALAEYDADLPKEGEVEATMDGALARFDLRQIVAARVEARRAEIAAEEARKAAEERAKKEARRAALAVEAARKQEEADRAKFEELKAKYGNG